MAVFGALLSVVFQSALERRLDRLDLAALRAQIEAQRSRLAAAKTRDARGRQALENAFVSRYRTVDSGWAGARQFLERAALIQRAAT